MKSSNKNLVKVKESMEIGGRNDINFSLIFSQNTGSFESHVQNRKEDVRFQNTLKFVKKYLASPCIFNSFQFLEIGRSPPTRDLHGIMYLHEIVH